jgi:hypothetical protein
MIGRIRNPWIRRPLVVAVWLPWSIALMIVGALAAVEDGVKLARGAWRGR